MCYHHKQTKDAQTLENRFDAKMEEGDFYLSEDFNAFTYPETPIITNEKPKLIQPLKWGLIPSWAKDNSIREYTLNAKIETLTEKPSFKNNIKNRCLVIVDGFYEWQWLDPKGKKKQKYLIGMPDDSAFAFAGLWGTWTDKSTGEIVNTYTIVTTEANPLMAEIHNSKKRMPVVLTKNNERLWLSGNPIEEFAKPDVNLKAVEV